MGIFEYLKRLIQELIDFNKTGVVERGNQKAVTGGAVYDYHDTTPLNPVTNLYIEKSGNVVNIQANELDGGDMPPLGDVIPVGYRPKRDVVFSGIVKSGAYYYPAMIEIVASSGVLNVRFITALGQGYRSSLSSGDLAYFNTSYIV